MFYADNGSSAVEVALKMSFHYWCNQGYPAKTRFVTLANSYHGETLGALAVGGVGLYKTTYEPLLMQALTAPAQTARSANPAHSYTGNPLACRAALASLDLLQDGTLIRNRQLAQVMGEAAAPLADHPQVGEVRQRGMILAIEMVQDKSRKIPYPWQERRGLRVHRHALSRGVLLRPLGNVIYCMPPYVITEAEIAFMVEVAAESLERAVAA